MTFLQRRSLLRAAPALSFASLAAPAGQARAQEAWPTKAVTLIVPQAAGGANDTVARAFAQRLSAAIGLACAQATAMRIDIAPHKRPRRKQTRHVPDPHYFHLPPHARLHQ